MTPPDADTTFYSETNLPTRLGTFRMRVYRHGSGGLARNDGQCETVAMICGDLRGRRGVPVRIHSECVTSEVFHSLKCDCREQLDWAMRFIQRHEGMVIYMRQEGRGIGLGNKVAAYGLQEQGVDTVDANRQLGLPDDTRDYRPAAAIIRDLGIESVRLMTNNPLKQQGLLGAGVHVLERIPVLIEPNEWSAGYLRAKFARMGHLLDPEIIGLSRAG